MKYPWLDAYCTDKPGSIRDLSMSWKATRWFLENKMFAVQLCLPQGRPVLNLKIEPSYGNLLQQEHPDIIPAYHMNKLHWCSVFLDGSVPEALLRSMVDESYETILAGLSTRLREKVLVRF